MRTWIFCFVIMLLSVCKMQAQNDPVLAGMIYAYTDKAEKELKNQEKVMLMQTTGHIWLKEEVEGTTNLQREFNNYLNSFRSIVVYSAQVYGFYHEIDRLVDNLGGFTKQLDKHPSNALAVALSAKRNKIYRELIMGSVEIVFGIRPKLKVMNKKLQRLTKAVKYTSMADIWAEIEEGSHDKADKKTIVKDCMNRWKQNGKIK